MVDKSNEDSLASDEILDTLSWALDERKNFKDRRQDLESSKDYENGLKKDRRVSKTDRRQRRLTH